MALLRRIDVLDVSPSGRRIAIFVRQGDPPSNSYVGGWFVIDAETGVSRYVGPGGDLRPALGTSGLPDGSIEKPRCRWSPNSEWIAYTVRNEGELQLWRSKVDGSLQEQVTRNAADVREFVWSDDGLTLYFTVGTARATLLTRQAASWRTGYQYDEDLFSFTDFMLPRVSKLANDSGAGTLWTVTVDDHRESVAAPSEYPAFTRELLRNTGQRGGPEGGAPDAVAAPIARDDGTVLWLLRDSALSETSSVAISGPSAGAARTRCGASECSGFIQGAWWTDDGSQALIWRREGIGLAATGFYSWSPRSGVVHTALRTTDDYLQYCDKAWRDRFVCVRQTPTRPPEVVAIDARSGLLQVLLDVNPEFVNIRLGTVERIEWDTPRFAWNEPGGNLANVYPKRTYGYVIYPPDFNPSKKYPIFIDPYSAAKFDTETSFEHPLHVYASHGMIVLRLQFPLPADVVAKLGASYMKRLYDAKLGFPHLTMLADSTIRALDLITARGFVDERRVGIGGASHGTFVPLFILQKYDRIAAVSISGATRGQYEYYTFTKKGREIPLLSMKKVGYEDWLLKPDGEGREFWRAFDIADHVEAIEAPILMNLPANETYGVIHLIRHMADSDKPYDAYVFPDETHIKWQPTHLQVIMNRNLDWFRFWLQGYEDPSADKAQQYARWHLLRRKHELYSSRVNQMRE